MEDEFFYVSGALSQRWRFNGNGAEAKEEVLPEFALLDHSVEITVGGRDESESAFEFPFGSQRAETPLLENPEEYPLGGKGEIPHLIEKEGAAVRLLNQTLMDFVGSRKGAFS